MRPKIDARFTRRAAVLAAACGVLLLSGGCAPSPGSPGDGGHIEQIVQTRG